MTVSSTTSDAAAGKLVTVTGTVVRATGTQPLITGMGFACGSCGEVQIMVFPRL